MNTYYIKRNDGVYVLRIKNEFLGDGLTYTESGNDITVTGYTGSNGNVSIVDKVNDAYRFIVPIFRLDVADYTINNNSGEVTLLKYIGNGGDIDTPVKEME